MPGGLAVAPDAGPKPIPIEKHQRNAEIQQAAGVSEAKIAAALTPEQQAQRSRIKKKEEAHDGNGVMRELAHRPEKLNIDHANDMIDFMVDDSGKQEEAKLQVQMYEDLLKPNGYDNLADDPATISRPPGKSVREKQLFLVGSVRNMLLANDATKDALATNLTDAKIVKMLKDPEFQAAITKALNEQFDPTSLPTKSEWIQANGAYDAAKDKVADVDASFRRVEGRRKAFLDAEKAFDTVAYKGTNTKRMEYTALQQDADVKQFLALEHRYQTARSDKERATIEATIRTARASVPKIHEFEQLRAEDAVNIKGIKDTDAENTTLKAELASAKTKEAEALAEKKRLDMIKASGGKEFQDKTADIVGAAITGKIIDTATARLDKYPTYQNEINAELRGGVDKQMETFMRDRYTTVKDVSWFGIGKKLEKWDKLGVLKKEQYVVRKDRADADLNRLIQIADGIAKNPGTGKDLRQEYVKEMLNAAKVDASVQDQLLADEAFVKGQFTSMAEKAFAMHTAGVAELGFLEEKNVPKRIEDARIEKRMKNFFESHPIGKQVSADILKANPEVAAKVEEITQAPVDEDSMKKLEEKKKGSGMLGILLALGLTVGSLNDLVPAQEALAA